MNYTQIYNKDYFNGKNSFFYMFGYGNGIFTTRFYNKIYQQIEKYFNKKKNMAVLDIGCAYGFMLSRFPNHFKKYGLDVSEHAIEKAKKRHPDINFKIGEIEKILPYQSNFFDVVIINDVIEHLKFPEKALNNIYTVLKKGGILYITTPNLNFIRKTLFAFADKREHHISLFSHTDLLSLLKKNKFNILEHWTFFILFFYLKFTSNIGIESGYICQKL